MLDDGCKYISTWMELAKRRQRLELMATPASSSLSQHCSANYKKVFTGNRRTNGRTDRQTVDGNAVKERN